MTTAIEYGLIAGLVSVVIIGALDSVTHKFNATSGSGTGATQDVQAEQTCKTFRANIKNDVERAQQTGALISIHCR